MEGQKNSLSADRPHLSTSHRLQKLISHLDWREAVECHIFNGNRMSAVLGAIFNCYKTNNTSTSMIPFFLCGRISVWGIVVEQAPHGLPLSKSLCCSLAITDSPSNPHLLDCCLILCAPSSYHVPLSGLLYLRAVM